MNIDDLIFQLDKILSDSNILRFIVEEVKLLGYNNIFLWLSNKYFDIIVSIQINPYLDQVLSIQMLIPIGCGDEIKNTKISEISKKVKLIEGGLMWYSECAYIIKEYLGNIDLSKYIIDLCEKMQGKKCSSSFNILNYSYDLLIFGDQ